VILEVRPPILLCSSGSNQSYLIPYVLVERVTCVAKNVFDHRRCKYVIRERFSLRR
jgi:hypothetical protein